MSSFDTLFELVDLGPEDETVIVSDTRSEEAVARLIFEEAQTRGCDASWMLVPARAHNGDELPRSVRSAILDSDLVILLTSWSPSHSAGVIDAMNRGARVMSMPGFRPDLVGRGATTADYGKVKQLTDRWGEHLGAGRRIRVTTAAGTDIEAELGGWSRLPLLDSGWIPRGIGGLGNFPGGEAAISPIEGTTQGCVVADLTSSTSAQPLASNIVLQIVDGIVVEIEGGDDARRLRDFLDAAGPSARVVAEIALGTNERALHIGLVLEDEKRLGTAHVGLGNARGFGGLNESPVHVDVVFAGASVEVDGVPLLVDGAPSHQGLRRESLSELAGPGGAYTAGPVVAEVRHGVLHAGWRDVRGFPAWSQVGDDAAALAAATLMAAGVLEAVPGTEEARVLELMERYRIVARQS